MKKKTAKAITFLLVFALMLSPLQPVTASGLPAGLTSIIRTGTLTKSGDFSQGWRNIAISSFFIPKYSLRPDVPHIVQQTLIQNVMNVKRRVANARSVSLGNAGSEPFTSRK